MESVHFPQKWKLLKIGKVAVTEDADPLRVRNVSIHTHRSERNKSDEKKWVW